jgi:F-type H+-transporting ATPase subunit b
MESLINNFHIDAGLLIAQVINFAIIFAALYFFALKPLLAVMNNRTKTIEKSLEDAKKAEENLNKAEEEYNKRIQEAKQEANAILKKTEEQAEQKKHDTVERAKQEIGEMITKEKEMQRAEKKKILREIKEGAADLIEASLEKILKEKIDSEKDKELIQKVLKQKQ